MELITIVQARDSLQKLIAQNIPIRQAYDLMKMTEKMNVHLNFYGNELTKINGNSEKKKELDSLEIRDLPEEKIRVTMVDGVMLSAIDIKKLEPFIDFSE